MNYNELDLIILKNLTDNKKNALHFASEFDAKLFSTDVWNFATVVVSYIKTNKDVPTLNILKDRLSNNKTQLDHIEKVWEQLDKITYDPKEYKYYLDKLKKRFAETQIGNMKERFSKLDPSVVDISKTINDMQKTIYSVRNLNSGNKAYESKNIKEYLPSFVETFNQRKNNPNEASGLQTKYSFIDFATNGLRPADFLLIAGESGFGKSLFLQNIGVQVWMQNNTIETHKVDFTMGKNIAYFSLEMPYEDCFIRLLSRLSGVASRSIENAKLNRDEFLKIKQCLDFISEYPYNFKIIDIANASANDLERILIEQDELFDAIFIDYLGIMKTNEPTEDADWLKQGIISQEVRAIARKYELPVFSAVQLNRKGAGKESSENIGLSRLARSATIATHATHVIQIESRVGEENHIDFLYHMIKNRKGPKGKGVLIKNLACATLLDKHEEREESNNYDDYFTDQEDISEEMEDLEL